MHKVRTTYLPATDSRGAQIRATSAMLGQLTIGFPYELSGSDCHREAANRFLSAYPALAIAPGVLASHARGFVFTVSTVG